MQTGAIESDSPWITVAWDGASGINITVDPLDYYGDWSRTGAVVISSHGTTQTITVTEAVY